MALTFNPVSVNLPTPPSFAGGQMGAPVDANALSSLAKLTDIQATRQGIATSQQALAKAQATYGADVAKAESEAKQKATEAQNAAFDYQNKEYNAFQTVISPHASDASVLAASKLTPQSTPEEVKKVQEGLLNLGESTVKELMNRGVSKIRAYQLVAPHFAETMTDPKLAAQNINLAVQKLAGPANIAEQNQPKLTAINGQPTMFSPQGGVTPVQGLQQPEAVPAGPVGNAPTGVSPGQMNMPPMQYPVRKAGQPYAQLPTEPKDIEAGQSYKNNLVNAQVGLTTMRRNIDEVIKEVDILEKNEFAGGAGVLGKVGREMSVFLGTEQGVRYKQLSKDLANAQITAIKASGGSLETDAGKQLARMASGDETFPPSVLKSIASRTKADLTNVDMQATAAQKFANIYGDQNLNTFKKLWADNADSKIFELKNIFDNPNMSTEEKSKARDKLLGNNPSVLKEFSNKWKNIEKLEKTGHL
jgi:hypothetical protein